VTLLQLAQIGRRMNVLENYFIQLFQHNNTMIKYKYWKKERKNFFLNWFTIYRCHACT